LGFNINFAPVADLGLTYGRSYSTNPDEVVRYAGAVGKAYDEPHPPGRYRGTTALNPRFYQPY